MNEKITNKSFKKRKNKGRIILISLLALILFIIAAGATSIGLVTSKMNKVNPSREEMGITPEIEEQVKTIKETQKVPVEEEAPATVDDIVNIALFGIDGGSNDSGRSDSIMILTIDPLHNTIKVASIMRDSYVNIPGYGMDKINHAFAFGNSTLALNTINSNFGLAIDKFVATNFTDMPAIIDKLGGVELNITSEELPHLKSSGITTTGLQLLNGEQALAYSRIRYTSGNDFERTSRHRTILGAVYKQLITVPVSKYPTLILDFLPLVETNLSNTELLSLGSTINKINGGELIEDRFPRDGFWNNTIVNGIYYLGIDMESTKEQLQKFIYE